MRSVQALPEGYREIFSVDLHKNKKAALTINLIAVAIAIVMVVPMLFFVPIAPLFSMEEGIIAYALRFVGLILFMLLYIILHELVHGITMKCCGTKKVKYGFTGIYAFAGSDDYYGKGSYITIALAPIVIFAIVFGVINALVPVEWFWVIYILQVINISGGAGDLYVTVKFSRFPGDILIRDHGVGMAVYSKQ